jgi:hypothetical protein
LHTDLAAKEEERVWIKRQIDGELDDSRLTEGLTGEAAVYKRRGMEKPEIGRPQVKYEPIVFKMIEEGMLTHLWADPNESGSSLISVPQCKIFLGRAHATDIESMVLDQVSVPIRWTPAKESGDR